MRKGIHCLTTEIILTLALTFINRGSLSMIMKGKHCFEGAAKMRFGALLLRGEREAVSATGVDILSQSFPLPSAFRLSRRERQCRK